MSLSGHRKGSFVLMQMQMELNHGGHSPNSHIDIFSSRRGVRLLPLQVIDLAVESSSDVDDKSDVSCKVEE